MTFFRFRRSTVDPEVDVLIGAEVFGDWNAVEVLADFAVVDGGDVEEQQEADEEQDDAREADDDEDELPAAVVVPAEGDERQDGVGQQEPEDEAEEVRVVVDPWQESGEEEDCGDADQLEDGHLRVLEHVPLMNDLDHAASEEAEVSPGGPDLGPVRHEDGGSEVADHAGAEIDERDSGSAGHLLQVSHEPILQGDSQGEVDDPEINHQYFSSCCTQLFNPGPNLIKLFGSKIYSTLKL